MEKNRHSTDLVVVAGIVVILLLLGLVLYILLYFCSDHQHRVWVGGREANPGVHTDGDVWLWDMSGAVITPDLWHTDEPDGIMDHDHAYIYKDDQGLCDWTESASYGGLCEIC